MAPLLANSPAWVGTGSWPPAGLVSCWRRDRASAKLYVEILCPWPAWSDPNQSPAALWDPNRHLGNPTSGGYLLPILPRWRWWPCCVWRGVGWPPFRAHLRCYLGSYGPPTSPTAAEAGWALVASPWAALGTVAGLALDRTLPVRLARLFPYCCWLLLEACGPGVCDAATWLSACRCG